MESEKCIEYALHMYDISWDYYKKTLDTRSNILNNYIILVGIPMSIIGIIIEKMEENIIHYSNWLNLALAFILVYGMVIYDAYIVESFISERYLKKIKKITQYLITNYDNNYEKVFSEVYSLDKIFLNRKQSIWHRIEKSFLVLVSNTAIIIIMVYIVFFNQMKWYYIIPAIAFSIFIHMSIYSYHERQENANEI